MRKHALMIAATGVIAVVVLAATVSAAWAISWSDLPDSLLSTYGITNDQVAQISQGFSNGLWRPDQQITRGQFAKMACLAFGIPQATPAVATFTDVPPGSTYYSYVEGAVMVGLVNGVSAGRYAPSSYITREQGLAIIARAVAHVTSTDLSTLYTESQLSGWLGTFSDGSNTSSSLRSAVAFAANLNIVRTAEGELAPRAWLTRLMAAVFLTRAGAPSVASVTPGQGSANGGDTVTIRGTNLADATAVKFGSADATSFQVISDTQIAAVAPAGTVGTSVNVVVTNMEGSSNVWEVTYTYTYPAPAISSVSPNSGSPNGGNTAIIDGSGFTGATAVQFGGTDATSFTVNSDTRITAVVTGGTAGTTVYVTVVGPAGTSAIDPTVCAYTYRYPAVTSVTPDYGPPSGGNTVTLNGIGFANLTGTHAVQFGDDDAVSYQVQSDTRITATVPTGAPGEIVTVSVDGQDPAITVYYAYEQTSITSVSLSHGPWGGGNTVTITGNGLTGVTNVYFGKQPSPSVTVASDTQIRAVVPAADQPNGTSSPRQVVVKVQTPDGSYTDWDEGWYQYDIPTVQWLSQTSATYNTQPSIEIHGIGFDCGAIIAVYFGSTPAVSRSLDTYSSGTVIDATVPTGSPGSKVTVYVVTVYGTSIDQVQFTYNP